MIFKVNGIGLAKWKRCFSKSETGKGTEKTKWKIKQKEERKMHETDATTTAQEIMRTDILHHPNNCIMHFSDYRIPICGDNFVNMQFCFQSLVFFSFSSSSSSSTTTWLFLSFPCPFLFTYFFGLFSFGRHAFHSRFVRVLFFPSSSFCCCWCYSALIFVCVDLLLPLVFAAHTILLHNTIYNHIFCMCHILTRFFFYPPILTATKRRIVSMSRRKLNSTTINFLPHFIYFINMGNCN